VQLSARIASTGKRDNEGAFNSGKRQDRHGTPRLTSACEFILSSTIQGLSVLDPLNHNQGCDVMQLTDQNFLSIKSAAAYLPTRPHVCTVWRWVTKGVRGHRLESWSIGGTRYTSTSAIDAFLSALNGGPVTVSKDRARHLKNVNRELDRELS
jgi:hypothetical protein